MVWLSKTISVIAKLDQSRSASSWLVIRTSWAGNVAWGPLFSKKME
jgi:hypothetical protein